MKLTRILLTKIIREVINEDGPESKKPQPPQQSQEQEPQSQKLKIDIPDSPFEPDVGQVKKRLTQILKQWKIKQYPSDEVRWKEYYRDILKVLKTIEGDV